MEGVRGEDERHTGRGPGEVGGWEIRRGGQVQFLGTILDLGASERGGPRVSCSGSWAEVGGPEGARRSRGRSAVCVALCGPLRPQCSYLAPR